MRVLKMTVADNIEVIETLRKVNHDLLTENTNKDKLIKDQEENINARETMIRRLKEDVELKDALIKELEKTYKEKDNAIKDLEKANKKQAEGIKKVEPKKPYEVKLEARINILSSEVSHLKCLNHSKKEEVRISANKLRAI